jgi:triosephosphate isomerase
MMLKTPLIIINFKAYETAIGEKAVKLAKICEKVAKETNITIAVAVQPADIYRVSHSVSIPVFTQHIDEVEFGSYTGSVLAECVKENGAVGTLLNHSEKRLRLDILEKAISRAKEVGLVTVVCANDPTTGKAIATFDCDFVAVEPPELIGGDISVSTAKPEVITDSIYKICNGVKCNRVLVGAGVKTMEDVKKAIELGASGILLASGVTKVENPESVLREMVNGIK